MLCVFVCAFTVTFGLVTKCSRVFHPEMMRLAGYPKTPDVLLQTPIEINGMVLYWIESKACFGDEATMTTNFREQLHPYLHRVGPGLVLYWFGFVSDLTENGRPLLSNWLAEGVMVASALPPRVRRRPDLPPPAMRTWRSMAAGADDASPPPPPLHFSGNNAEPAIGPLAL